MTMDCIPPHARTLPVIDSGERCTECKAKIASLEGLLAQTQRDLATMTGRARHEAESARILSAQLIEARALIPRRTT